MMALPRRALLYTQDRGHTVQSFPLLLASKYLYKSGISPQPALSNPKHLNLGNHTHPTA